MGHKVHPTGFRLGVIRDWSAKWYADRHYRDYLQEDLKLRGVVGSMYPEAGISKVEIDRQANNVSLTIHTARPGILIGRGGQRVDEMRTRLEGLIGKRVQLNIREVSQPELDAQLVARNVCDQLERRIAYRRTLKQSLLRSMQAGAKGMRISIGGRLDGAEIARRVTMHEGQVPLHTLRADIDYGFSEARTAMGRVGVKVWLYKGDILPEAREVELEEVIQEPMTAPDAITGTPEEPMAEVVVEEIPEELVAEDKPQPKTRRRAKSVEETLEEPVEEDKPQPITRKRTKVAAAKETVAEAETVPVSKKDTKKDKPDKAADAATTEEPRPKKRTRAAVKADVEETGEAVVEPVVETESTSETPENQGEGDATT